VDSAIRSFHTTACSTAARAGTPVAVIQAQLGHGSPMLTLTKYGRFLPSTADRAKWETAATEYETRRCRSTSDAG